MTGTAHACRVDRSPDTGSLVVCTCSYAAGPFQDHALAVAAARSHRQVVDRQARTEEQREARNAQQRQRRLTATNPHPTK